MCLRLDVNSGTSSKDDNGGNARKCPDCGQVLTPIARKCPNCGADVSGVRIPIAPPKDK